MKKHSVRKWLHAILDLLPVILIPVFMVYSHRHEINSNQVQVQENFKVNFNQQIIHGNFDENVAYNVIGANTSLNISDNVCTFSYSSTNTLSGLFQYYQPVLIINHIYYARTNVLNKNDFATYCSIGQAYDYSNVYLQPNVDSLLEFRWSVSNNVGNYRYVYIGNRGATGSLLTFSVFNFQLFDLTQMFGVGNEPTIDQFKSYFSNAYYDYTLSNDLWLANYRTVTYDDTDIMSQITYQLYNATDKYFNMDKTFNLGNIHTWVNNNMFNGQPPLVANIVWHIISYEFIMDLVFLVYAVFMFIIDFADRCINSFFDKSFGGGR